MVDLLLEFAATPVHARVVTDGNVITGAQGFGADPMCRL